MLLLSLVQFMDILDASILNIALPSIKHDLGFSQQSLQWVVDGYILTYGGFLLLGARMADLLGRRFVLVTGLVVFAGASLTGGLSHSSSLLVGARFAQGIGAALLSPAALSSLTTTFRAGRDRHTALGVWGAVSGLGGAAGVLFGGLLTEGPGWRWVLFVNVPLSAVAFFGAFALLKRERIRDDLASFDALGALLVTGGMLLLVYALVKAPDVGWGATRTIAELAGAVVMLASFVINELRGQEPARAAFDPPGSGMAVADVTQLVAVGGFVPMFFFLTLYMQTVLHFSPIQTGARVPAVDGRLHHLVGHRIAAVREGRHQAGDRRGGSDRGCRPVLDVAHPGRRLVPRRHPAGDARDLSGRRRRVRRRHHRGERGHRRGEGGSCRRAAEHRPAGRHGTRPGDALGARHRAHELAPRVAGTPSPTLRRRAMPGRSSAAR